jgi:hypothetical protein
LLAKAWIVETHKLSTEPCTAKKQLFGVVSCGLRAFFQQIHSPYDYFYFKLLNYSGFSVFFENPVRPGISNLMGE